MKRSDALLKLKRFLEYQNPYDESDPQQLILDFVERVLGMAPPWYDKLQDNNGDVVVIPVREWEE